MTFSEFVSSKSSQKISNPEQEVNFRLWADEGDGSAKLKPLCLFKDCRRELLSSPKGVRMLPMGWEDIKRAIVTIYIKVYGGEVEGEYMRRPKLHGR